MSPGAIAVLIATTVVAPLAAGLPSAWLLVYSTACRHPGIAITIAAATFPDQRFGATILLYLVTAFVFGLAYSTWNRRRQEVR